MIICAATVDMRGCWMSVYGGGLIVLLPKQHGFEAQIL